jgi:hypothetical protein
MSRVLEVVVEDAPEVVIKRAYAAFRKIGRIQEFDPAAFVEGRVFVEGYQAHLTVEWRPHRDTGKIRLDLAATSGDELSRAADASLYLFARTYKALTPKEWERLSRPSSAKSVVIAAFLVAAALLIAAWFLGYLPIGEKPQ